LRAFGQVLDAPELVIGGWGPSVVEPAGLVALAAGCAQRRARGLRTRVEADVAGEDGAGETVEALRRMDFFRVLGLEAGGAPQERLADIRVVDLRAIDSEAAARQVATACEALLRVQMPSLASSLRRFARNVIEELGVNIVQHSGAPSTGFAMAQAWSDGAPRFQLAAADAGVGFLASLQRNPELAGRVEEDADALQLALTKGLSGAGTAQNSGFGLEMLRHLSDLLDADLRLISGGALLHRRTVAGQRANVVRPAGPWRGAWIVLDAPLAARPG
jgi:hypothetical protein